MAMNLSKELTNKNLKEDTKMSKTNKYEISTEDLTINNVKFTLDYQKRNGAVIPVIDGQEHPELLMQYTSQADLEAGMKVLKDALEATNGNIYQAMQYMYSAAMTTARGITPNKQIDIEGQPFQISYEDRKAYTLTGEEVVNLDDFEGIELGEDAIEKLLKDKLTDKMQAIYDECEDEYDDEDEDTDYEY